MTAVSKTTAAVLIVGALAIGLLLGMAIGYNVSNSTSTPTLTQETEVFHCVVAHYLAVAYESFNSTTTWRWISTSTSLIQTYQSTTAGSETVGYAITWTTFPTTTETGSRNWDATICTVISGG